MVKNVVFWSLEKTPIGDFTPETLVDRTLSAFRYLKEYLENQFLPCYMIPERNLFDGRMEPGECTKLLREVENIIGEGYGFISLELTRSNPEKAKDHEEVEDIMWMLQKKTAPRVVKLNKTCASPEAFFERLPQKLAKILCEECKEPTRRLLQLLGFPADVTMLNIMEGPAEKENEFIIKLFITRLEDALS